jgi:hypothetical protein
VRLGQASGARVAWWDRVPTSSFGAYRGAGIAPHTLTTRWSYTVPTNRRAMVETLFCGVTRQTLGSGPAETFAMVSRDANTDPLNPICMASVVNNSQNLVSQVGIGTTMFMIEGQSIYGITYDATTGGTVNYAVSANWTEFDVQG